jgi:transketolase
VEHLASLRAIPGLDVVRPADANETAVAWRTILSHNDRPAGLCLSRQNLPILDRSDGSGLGSAEGVQYGGYVLADAVTEGGGGPPDVVLLATGSEVHIALEARELLQAGGITTRVVSLPCVEWFRSQDQGYQDRVLPPSVRARVSVEAAVGMGWRELVGDAGRIVSLEHFGASAAYQVLYEQFGFTAARVADLAKESLAAVAADKERS